MIPAHVRIFVCTYALDDTPLAKAIGYARNQRDALRRFLDDGRLPLHNNASELQLRREVIGRRNWLFVGSDEAAEVNTTFVSLLASCGLHKLEPWAYLRHLLCLLPGWPRSRVLQLAPAYWKQTGEDADTQRRLPPIRSALPRSPSTARTATRDSSRGPRCQRRGSPNGYDALRSRSGQIPPLRVLSSEETLRRFVARVTRLYEQGRGRPGGSAPLGFYLRAGPRVRRQGFRRSGRLAWRGGYPSAFTHTVGPLCSQSRGPSSSRPVRRWWGRGHSRIAFGRLRRSRGTQCM